MSLDALTGSRAWILAGWTMLHFLWVGAGLGAIGAVARRLGRRASPERRYALALASFASVAMAPAAIAAILYGQIEPGSRILDDAEVGRGVSALPAPVIQRPDSGDLMQPVLMAPLPPSRWDVQRLAAGLPWVWVLGAPATFALLATGLVGAERLRRGSRVLTEGVWAEKVRELCGALGIARHVALAVCDRVVSPTLVGVVRPLILLPASALSGWTPEEVELALLHELAHVRRHDNLVNLLQRLVESALFFHPAVWIASGWVRLEREHCCDRLVVARTGLARPYAELLATLASMATLSRMSPSAAMAEAPVVDRIRQILNLPPNEAPRMPIAPSLLALCATLFLTPAALVVAQAVEKNAAKDPKAAVAVSKEDRVKIEQIIARARRGSEVYDGIQERAYNLISIANLKSRLGDREAARQTYREAAALGEKVELKETLYEPHILQWVAQAQIKAGFPEDGSATLRTLLTIAKGPARNEMQLANLYINVIRNFRVAGDAEGVKAVQDALDRLRVTSKDPVMLAQSWASPVGTKASAGDLRGALRLLDDLSIYPDRKPESVAQMRRKWLFEIVMLIKGDNRDGAEAIFEAALRDIDGRPDDGGWLAANSRINDWALVAAAQARSGHVDQAFMTAKLIFECLSKQKSSKVPLFDDFVFHSAQSFAEVAEAAQAAGDRKLAVEAARWVGKAVALPGSEPSKGHPRGRAARVLARAGEVDEALALAEAGHSKNRAMYHGEIAACLRERGDEEWARKVLRMGVKELQDRAQGISKAKASEDGTLAAERNRLIAMAANFQALMDDTAAAKETVRQINSGGDRNDAYRDLAVTRAHRGDLDGALAMIGEIRSPQDESEALKLTLGVIAERKPAR